jgi:hypothetical protein
LRYPGLREPERYQLQLNGKELSHCMSYTAAVIIPKKGHRSISSTYWKAEKACGGECGEMMEAFVFGIIYSKLYKPFIEPIRNMRLYNLERPSKNLDTWDITNILIEV